MPKAKKKPTGASRLSLADRKMQKAELSGVTKKEKKVYGDLSSMPARERNKKFKGTRTMEVYNKVKKQMSGR